MQEYDATCLIKKFNDVAATIMIDQVEVWKLKLSFFSYPLSLIDLFIIVCVGR